MVLAPRNDGGSQIIPFRIRSTIQSIREIVGDHSDADIYAMLKETNMDPNETAQRLLYQDPFHEVKRRRDRKKEPTGYKSFSDTRKHVEPNLQWAKSSTSLDLNLQRENYIQKSIPSSGIDYGFGMRVLFNYAGISRQFRVVRDNRANQNAKEDAVQETIDQLTSSIGNTSSSVIEKSNDRDILEEQLSVAPKLGQLISAGSGKSIDPPSNANETGSSASQGACQHREAKTTALSSRTQDFDNNYRAHSKTPPSNSSDSLYYSFSDPVHVPSANSLSAGKVGAIRREVGAVGAQRQPPNYRASQSSVSTNSFSISLLRKDVLPQTELPGHSIAAYKSNQLNQVSTSVPTLLNTPMGKSAPSNQHNGKVQRQSVSSHKGKSSVTSILNVVLVSCHFAAMQVNMEWKPKSTRKPNIDVPATYGTVSAAPSSADNSISSKVIDVTGLSKNLSKLSILENQHVIIPQHLQVPESELARLTFGSFEVGFDTNKYTYNQSQRADDVADEPSMSSSASPPLVSNEDTFTVINGGTMDVQVRTSQSDYPASVAESEELPTGNESTTQHIGSYADIGLVKSGSLYNSEQQLKNPESLSNFGAYDNQSGYDVPFLRTVMEDNAHIQDLASSSEVLNSLAASFSPLSNVAVTQQQQFVHQPQQSLPQMYPQVHMPHYPNFVPYRHIFSPIYVPPIAMPNYSSNPPYPHPSNGNNFVLMPGGSSQISPDTMKYALPQYKPLPTGSPTAYTSYSNSAFSISSPVAVGSTTGIEDFSRVKYKDSSLYVLNQQAETSDLWIQTPRDVPNLPSAPYYNLPAQSPHAAFMPGAHAGHASFSAAAQIPHVQYPGLYHPTQPASIATPHQLLHHQVSPAIGGGVGVGLAAPGPQVGTYQQSQLGLGHLNWTGNF
ncbi:hypothetical protein ZIOFF_026490 [Zingiber officinale]|uniref:GBF-interacting protein 1 N-terminal domain-containing protein n=1 Tax=Zingiber officinale TaxID=94328 RepID=A0A8J5H435_ZINOF|nr:hypothetical protein ZIOFF_026490 [Zingiber officinale]